MGEKERRRKGEKEAVQKKLNKEVLLSRRSSCQGGSPVKEVLLQMISQLLNLAL